MVGKASIVMLLMAATVPAAAGQSCNAAGRSYPEGAKFRSARACSGLTCRVIECRHGVWSPPDQHCRLDYDCPPPLPH